MVITCNSPIPGESGSVSYLIDILQYLADKGYSVNICWVGQVDFIKINAWYRVPDGLPRDIKLSIIGELSFGRFKIFPLIRLLPFKARLLHALKKFLKVLGLFTQAQKLRKKTEPTQPASRQPIPVWREPPTQAEVAFVGKNLRCHQPDIVLANYCWMNEAVNRANVALSAFRAVLAHDVQHQRLYLIDGRLEEDEKREFPRTREEEWLLGADAVLAISEPDARVFRGFPAEMDVTVVTKAFTPNNVASRLVAGRCLFVGSLAHFNVEGLSWFLRSVWPVILQAQPHATLHVCGAVCRAYSDEENVPGVTFYGVVDSLDGHYAEAEVVVLPLLEGSGVKTKLVEAFSYGKACVTTSIGLHGLPFFKDDLLLSDSATEFAKNVNRLLHDNKFRSNLENKSRQSVQEHLSRDQCYSPVCQLFNRALNARMS